MASSSLTSPRRCIATVLFDGQCNFCTSQIGLLKRLDFGRQLTFLSLHDDMARQSAVGLSFEQLMEQMWVITADGTQYGGADAVRYLSRTLPPLYPLAPLLHFPGLMPLWRFLYRLIANYRYRIAGRNCEHGTCDLHARKR